MYYFKLSNEQMTHKCLLGTKTHENGTFWKIFENSVEMQRTVDGSRIIINIRVLAGCISDSSQVLQP